MNKIEQDINDTVDMYKQGKISLDEKKYLLEEIHNVRIAQECANDEALARSLYQICRSAMMIL